MDNLNIIHEKKKKKKKEKRYGKRGKRGYTGPPGPQGPQGWGTANPTTTTGDMIYSNPGSSLTRLPIGTQGQYVRTNSSGLPEWSNFITPSTESRLFDDFTGTVAPFGDTQWTTTASGTGAAVTIFSSIAPTNTRVFGSISLTKGTLAAGRISLNKSVSSLFLGFGTFYFEAGIMIPTIPDGTDNFIIRVGLGDSTTNVESLDGLYFLIDRTVSTTNWALRGLNNSSITTNVSTATFSSGTWQRLGFLVNADGTSATFTIGGSSVGTVTTNIPVGSLRLVGLFVQIIAVAGTAARNIIVDYITYNCQFNAVRY